MRPPSQPPTSAWRWVRAEQPRRPKSPMSSWWPIGLTAALRPRRSPRVLAAPPIGGQVRLDHRRMLPDVDRLRAVADGMDMLDSYRLDGELHADRAFLEDVVLPHEKEEDAVLYPIVAPADRRARPNRHHEPGAS